MVPSIVLVCDREFCCSFSSPSSPSSDSTLKTKQHTVMKFCKNVDISHPKRLVILINPRRACAAKITVVGLSVCVCVDAYSGNTGYEAAY